MRLCSIDGCDNPHKARGYCSTHWGRWRRHGNPHTVLAQVKPRPKGPYRPCSKTGCDDPHYARGICAKHYRRWQREREPEPVDVPPTECVEDCDRAPMPGGLLRCREHMLADLDARVRDKEKRRRSSYKAGVPDPARVGVKQVRWVA